MIEKLLIILKKYKMVIITAVIVLFICTCFLIVFNLFTKRVSLKKINTENYMFQYDNTWKPEEIKKNKIVLKHNSGSKITTQIIKIAGEYHYLTIDELIDDLIYNIEKENKNYKFISKKQAKITKYQFSGYKLLYENKKEQVMLNLYKKSDKLILIKYEAKNNYFDILLDSVHNIIYNLNIKDEKFDVKSSIKLNTEKIEYKEDKEVDKLLKASNKYEIAKSNYYVEYSLPSNFVQTSLDSTLGIFNYKIDNECNMQLVTTIRNQNIYEYLDKNSSLNVYKNYSTYQKKGDDYSNYNESLEKQDSNYLGYIYKNSYTYNKAVKFSQSSGKKEYKRQDENIEMIYALDKNHILTITIRSVGKPITEKMIKLIKVNNFINYASYIKQEKENGFIIGVLQRFQNGNKKKLDSITLRIPEKYEELDKNQNIYENRNYGWNYNEELEIYDYNVHYGLTTLSDDSIIKSINSSYISSTYGEAHDLQYSNNLTVNDKEFKVYNGGYTGISGIMFTSANRIKYYIRKKVLFYQLPSGGNLYIEISGNGKDITDEIVDELVSFTIEEKEI